MARGIILDEKVAIDSQSLYVTCLAKFYIDHIYGLLQH